MAIIQELVANELAELIEEEMRIIGMNVKKQVDRLKGPVTSRKSVDGMITIWDSVNGKIYNKKSFIYRIITAQDSSISGSIFGPHPHFFARDSTERRLIDKITQKLETKGYSLYKQWGTLAEYRPVIS